MADAFIYNMSSRNDFVEQVATKKEVVWIQDQNNSSYNGSISINTTSIANSGKFADYSSAYLVIPYVVSFTDGTNLNALVTRFTAGLKNGSHQLIHAMSVDWNSVNIVQLTSFLNIYCSYKFMTTWSYNDMVKNGSTCGFWKDSVDSIIYNAAAATNGTGFVNNSVTDVVTNFSQGGVGDFDVARAIVGYNEGYRKRLSFINYSATANGDGMNILTAATASAVGVSSITRTAANGVYYIRYNAVIRLSDISDFFEKVPLCKGGVLNFQIYYNAGSLQVNVAGAAGNLNVVANSVVLSGGQTIPYMFSANSANQPNASITARVLTMTSNVVSSGGNAAGLSSCRLYVPLYTLTPTMEDELLNLNTTKLIRYKDIYQYTIPSTAAGGSFNQLLTNGLSRPQTLIICPFTSTGNLNTSSLTNPFSSAPATCDPYFLVNGFNVLVSGINLFTQNLDYTFVEFQNELSRINAVNGNVSSGLTSGLIDQHDYERGYGYIVCDLSRTLNPDDAVPKSILVYGNNQSNQGAIYYCFVEYLRIVNLNLATGDISLP
jgi:hypothetical protein